MTTKRVSDDDSVVLETPEGNIVALDGDALGLSRTNDFLLGYFLGAGGSIDVEESQETEPQGWQEEDPFPGWVDTEKTDYDGKLTQFVPVDYRVPIHGDHFVRCSDPERQQQLTVKMNYNGVYGFDGGPRIIVEEVGDE